MQALEPADFPRRVIYCEWLLKPCREHTMPFSSATTLTFGQQWFSINVWTGIVKDRLVGPYVLPNRLNQAHCLEFLNNVLESS